MNGIFSIALPSSYKAGSRTPWLCALLMVALLLPTLTARAAEPEVGIVENLGEQIPLDIELIDEQGETILLGELIEKPTILALVYYTCPGICNPLLGGLAEVVDAVRLSPGDDFQVISVSFDPADTPAIARAKKKNYLTTIMKNRSDFPPDAWRWLTASETEVKRLTEAVGFKYTEDETGEEYLHSAALIALSPKGKIARYLFGTEFLPFDLKMAVTEAAEGRTGPTVTKLLRYCFSYDPQGRTYTLNLLRIIGTTMTLSVVGFLGFLVYSGRKSRQELEQNAR